MSPHGAVWRLIAIIRRTSWPSSQARFVSPYYHVASAAAGDNQAEGAVTGREKGAGGA